MPSLRPYLRFAPVGLIPLLAACGTSPATRFYTLDALPPRTPSAAVSGPVVRLDQVQVPSVLDRPELVHEYAQGQLKVDDFSHWGAPLGQLIRSSLVQDLSVRLPSGNLAPATGPHPAGTVGIAVEILSVDSSASGMTMDVVWTATVVPPAGGKAQPAPMVTSHTSRLSAANSAADPSSYVAGLSAMLANLADEIAAATAVR